jgi:alpha-glucosidase
MAVAVPKGGRRSATQKHPKEVAKTPWWQTGIVYQIYVRSFFDSNGDGVGDLQGVIAKLDYLQSLGIAGIWLSPVTVSGNADWGYDVVDYRNVDPALGTMADFEQLIKAAHQRQLKVLLDFVPNHTSTQHPWFQNALTSRDAKYRDYYIWADGKSWGRRPNNWRSWFGGSAWQYHRPTKQYYLHNFLPQQADLNWRNPKVQEEFDGVMRFWLDKGVDGFRIDVANMLIKDKLLRNNPKSSERDDFEIWLFGQRPTYTTSRPEVHQILKRWRKIADSYPERKLLLGETTMVYNIKDVARFYGTQDELELAFNFNFLRARFLAPELKKVVLQTENVLRLPDWPVWTNSNHDERSRFATRWAQGDERKIRCGLLILLALRGTPVMYYGDEIGLQNVYVPPWRTKDPWGKRFWPFFTGRDRGRTPMPWKLAVGAGFTGLNVKPWLPYGKLEGHNVEEQQSAGGSTLNFTKALIALRHQLPELQTGEYHQLHTVSSVWAWRRGKNILVAINMSRHHQELTGVRGEVLLDTERIESGYPSKGNRGARSGNPHVDDLLHLKPWQGVIIRTE